MPPVPLSDLAVPSAQGRLHLPSWLGRKRLVPQHAMVVLGCSLCMRTRGLASLTPALCVAAGVAWSSSAGSCHLFRMGQEFGLPKLVRGTTFSFPASSVATIEGCCLSQPQPGPLLQEVHGCVGWQPDSGASSGGAGVGGTVRGVIVCTPLPDCMHGLCAAQLLRCNHLCPCGLSRQSNPVTLHLSSQAVWVMQHWDLQQS